jgi:plastocyanin
MSGVFLLFLMLFGLASLQAMPAAQKPFVGCLNRLPDGTLQLGAVPSGELYLLRGQTNVLMEHVNQLVRVFGQTGPRGSNHSALATLVVGRVQPLSNSCTSALPAKELDGVPGKVGQDGVAVPLTTTFTEGQSTPGYQTEAATAESTSSKTPTPTPAAELPAAPVHPEQVGESEAAANANAGAVERTEILPESTLGVAGSTAAAGPAHAVGHQPAVAAKSASAPVTVTIIGNSAPKLSPPRVTIKAGQTVEWRNSSASLQELIANPARETQSSAALPAGAKPFDSGFLRQGHSFEHRFSVPGVYRYVCKVNDLTNPVQAMGEVIVQR